MNSIVASPTVIVFHGIWVLCLVHQLEVSRFDQFQKNSTAVAPLVLTPGRLLCLWIKVCKPLSSMVCGSELELLSGICFQLN